MRGQKIFQKYEFCGVGDVCAFLKISRSGVRRIIDEKRIPSVLISAGRIFLRSDVEEYQKLREKKAAAGDRRIHLKKNLPSS